MWKPKENKLIAQRKLALKERQKELEKSITETILNPKDIILYLVSGLANRLIMRKDRKTIKKMGLFGNSIQQVEKGNNLFQNIFSFITLPAISSLFIKTRKAQISWQIITIALLIGKKIWDNYNKKNSIQVKKTALYRLKEFLGFA